MWVGRRKTRGADLYRGVYSKSGERNDSGYGLIATVSGPDEGLPFSVVIMNCGLPGWTYLAVLYSVEVSGQVNFVAL
jgi:hypothetical protein